MASIVQRIIKHKLIQGYPEFVKSNLHYETIMGSYSYGVNTDMSDTDVYGFCIPPKDDIFPHLRGEIYGFSTPKKRFENYQVHHIKDNEKQREYDIDIFNIVKYFKLCMDCNPNVIDSLFTPDNCVLTCTSVGDMVRKNRNLFLSKKAKHTFLGYAHSQLKKMENKEPIGKRALLIEQFGYDVKYASHVVRLVLESEQILENMDLNLQKDNEVIKSIRRGEWKKEDIDKWFYEKERSIETLYNNSNLRHSPNEELIRDLLINCLEHHYGSIDKVIHTYGNDQLIIAELENIILKFKENSTNT